MNYLEPHNFFFNLPIYTSITIDDSNGGDFLALINLAYLEKPPIFEGYNPIRKMESSFYVTHFSHRWPGVEHFRSKGGFAEFYVKCKRWDDLFNFFIRYDKEKEIITKIGQYPSIADFHIHEVKQYAKVLPKEKLREFTRAIGLAANGIGIGSFVYLRRIFESLIEEAHTITKKDEGWNEDAFSRARMGDKIQMLAANLPPFLVDNKSLYGILSVGVHALNEEDCLAHFDTVRVGIELILDEKLEAFERKRKVEEAQQKLVALTSKVKGQQ
jgi:hypothetical protein